MSDSNGKSSVLTPVEWVCLQWVQRHGPSALAETEALDPPGPPSVLSRLESLGLVERVTVPSVPLEFRHSFYRLTAAGHRALREMP